jgi:hypothetical protein
MVWWELRGKDWFIRISFLSLHNMIKSLSGFDCIPLEKVGVEGKYKKKIPYLYMTQNYKQW